MERIKRNRRFVGLALIFVSVCLFLVFHVPVVIRIPYISPRISLRFASLFVYTFIYAFVFLGASIKRASPCKQVRKVVPRHSTKEDCKECLDQNGFMAEKNIPDDRGSSREVS
ncbi:hypothetical protein CWI42_011750 [Ordospora colligata]|uniref:Uncharacterized protein n=1 Tax=Ordospora colligata OC4 TaxID=1354746 RepID=A0A0B2UNI2_9MICR|nr:uncharacterized protein M896_011750 [Ordospora colligata OC4]KHN70520.1 hypothetical protein M896_011750 [Ordospora colligata OC4]TBU17270.1 hypothetical protein CWI41_011750 [Ordospora colligata]TBU17520.1 hypothetical protein CWI40_011750 [Ordospora colligata]TBU19700.1 hypothetical protein CWI42_011750 [Ordospora colligata]